MKAWDEIYKIEKRKGGGGGKTHPDLPKVVRLFKKNNVKRILDLGCGAGRNLVFLAKEGFEVWGIDSSKEALKISRQWLKEINKKGKLIWGDIYKTLPFKENFFDALISIRVLHHNLLEKIRRAIKEIERVLKNKGILFATVLGKEKIKKELAERIKFVDKRTYKILRGPEKGLYHFHFNKRIIKKEFKNFKILKIWQDKENYLAFLGILQKRE